MPVQSDVGIGKIVNMMEQDCMQIANSLLSIHTIWKVPLLMAVGMTFLYDLVGTAAFGALGVMILVNAIQSIVVPFLFKGFYAIKKITDSRIKVRRSFILFASFVCIILLLIYSFVSFFPPSSNRASSS